MASKRDYYEVLGVSKSASADELKRAYRKLAMQHHPDKHGGDDSQFKEISEAYDTLKDPQKRAAYDQFGHAGAQGFGGGDAGFGGFDFSGFGGGAQGFDFSDILNQFMGGMGGAQTAQRERRGRDLQISLELDFKEAVFGVEKEVTLDADDTCETCNGDGAKPGAGLKTCGVCSGQGYVVTMQRTILGSIQQRSLCATCRGRGQVPKEACGTCKGSGVLRRRRELKLRIPAGIDNGNAIRVTGQGSAPQGGGPKGDLYVQVRVRGDKRFEREGKTIYSEAQVPMVDAALGTEIEVETVDGPVTLKVPAGTQSGKVFKLEGHGVPGGRSRGDHLVTVAVETPTKLSSRQKELLQQFSAESGRKGLFR